MTPTSIHLQLPDWVPVLLAQKPAVFGDIEERMALVIELAQRNVTEMTGGPFGAAIFESHSGRLLAAGVNLVVPQHCSVAHAEMVAIMLAQRAAQTFDLSAPGLPACELVTSTEPCAMCMGAIPWSGVQRVVCGARDEDARAAGFDEGHKPPDWISAYHARGITVIRDILRTQAAQVLLDYQQKGGHLYNPQRGSEGERTE